MPRRPTQSLNTVLCEVWAVLNGVSVGVVRQQLANASGGEQPGDRRWMLDFLGEQYQRLLSFPVGGGLTGSRKRQLLLALQQTARDLEGGEAVPSVATVSSWVEVSGGDQGVVVTADGGGHAAEPARGDAQVFTHSLVAPQTQPGVLGFCGRCGGWAGRAPHRCGDGVDAALFAQWLRAAMAALTDPGIVAQYGVLTEEHMPAQWLYTPDGRVAPFPTPRVGKRVAVTGDDIGLFDVTPAGRALLLGRYLAAVDAGLSARAEDLLLRWRAAVERTAAVPGLAEALPSQDAKLMQVELMHARWVVAWNRRGGGERRGTGHLRQAHGGFLYALGSVAASETGQDRWRAPQWAGLSVGEWWQGVELWHALRDAESVRAGHLSAAQAGASAQIRSRERRDRLVRMGFRVDPVGAGVLAPSPMLAVWIEHQPFTVGGHHLLSEGRDVQVC